MNVESVVLAPPMPSGPLTVLIIDDEAAMRDLLRLTLEREGHRVLAAASGQEGREIAFHLLPDIVLCDVHMPGISGHQVLEALRSDYQTRQIPFIFLTGCREKQSIRLGMAGGAAEYLVKPFRAEELAESIAICARKLAFFEHGEALLTAKAV